MLEAYGNKACFEYNSAGIRVEKCVNGVPTKYVVSGSTILSETTNNVSTVYYHSSDGVIGFNRGGVDYFYRKNIQSDIIAIVNTSGDIVAKYVYDAWGNHKIYSSANTLIYDSQNPSSANSSHIGCINPFRYRSYYFDSETGLYYLNSRYYDPQVGRFLNADTVDYLEPESIQGLNLYSYCQNNPIVYADPSGHAPEWLQIAGWIGLGVGILVCGVAIGILTVGVGSATFLGAVAVGAAKGALIGATIGVGAGAIVGGAGALISGEEFGSSEFWSDVLYGGMLGFGVGAVVGAVAGGFHGAKGWYNAKALEFTNVGSNEVVLGRSPGYVDVARSRGATYFHTTDDVWNATKSMRGVGSKGMWRINKAFLRQQINAGAHFTLVNPASGYFYAKEVAYVMKYGIYAFL